VLFISFSREAAVIISASSPPPPRALLVALRRGGTAGSQYHVRCTRRAAVALRGWLEKRARQVAPWDPPTAEILAEAATVMTRAIALDRA
jgi:hypothetical protein